MAALAPSNVVAPAIDAAAIQEKKQKSVRGRPRAPHGAKPVLTHPPYLQMVKEAISSLKERSGSSQKAIAKFLQDHYKSALPGNFKKILSTQLKKLNQKGEIAQVKMSYKLSHAPKLRVPGERGGRPKGSKNKPKLAAAGEAAIAASVASTPIVRAPKRVKPARKSVARVPKKATTARAKIPKKAITPTKRPKSVKASKPTMPVNAAAKARKRKTAA